MMRFVAMLIVALVAVLSPPVCAGERPRIAIIIDDLGYQLAAGRRAIALPGPVSFAILPGAPNSSTLARSAHASGRDVLLHLPMQAPGDTDHADEVAAQPTVTLDLSRNLLADLLDDALASVPHAVGVNNHRGSLITRHPGHMQWLMEEILERETVFFVDSYTTHHSVALAIAAEAGVPATKRDVFLDNDTSPEGLARAFERLKRLSTERGAAVAIGHPYPETLAFLEQALPRLVDEGYELVAVSELVRANRAVGLPTVQARPVTGD